MLFSELPQSQQSFFRLQMTSENLFCVCTDDVLLDSENKWDK